MKQRLTGKEIAQIAGVSPTAVSLVKKGKSGVSEEKRREILALLKEAGYTGIADEGTAKKTIALLFRDDLYELKQIFYHEVMDSILRTCRDQPYNIVVKSIDYENDAYNAQVFANADTWDAAIICSDPKDSILCHLFQKSVPFVIVDSSAESKVAYAVCVDYEAAAHKMTNYLIEKGHQEIAYIGNAKNTEDHSFTIHSLNGFQRALQEHGIVKSMMVCLNAYNETRLQAFIDLVIEGPVRPTALFCSTDNNAIQAIRYLWQKGLRVPQDISVVGMDDIVVSRYTTPALTTMRVDREELSRMCIQMLDKLISGKKIRSAYIAPCELIERESVASPTME